KSGANIIAWCEPNYPPLLRMTEGAPPVISVIGNLHLLQNTCVGIVGARNASVNGLNLARRMAADLGKGGYGCSDIMVTSGMARGIDTAAHQGSLETGTIAVLAGGIDKIYPSENERLYHEIAERGVIIAEMPIGTQPSGKLFPVRNRIISGVSKGIVVIEAAPRSGSLITARLALEQGREVFSMPGSPGDPRARGTNGLIRDGAILTENAGDVLQVLGEANFLASKQQISFDFNVLTDTAPVEVDIDSARNTIIELLDFAPVAVDELVRNCQFSIAAVTAALLELELAGRLERHPGNRVSLLNEQ
ncbi:MAG: DNA-protecting protein DprA, partial [Rhodospirillales bacterium]|nr:DNA-protecting protein DprA [Rhodospirillales bacterium]